MEVLPGKDGLVHISELADFRVKATEDVVKMGDVIWVKCIGVNEKGRVRLSRKAAMAERAKELEPKTADGAAAPAGGSPARPPPANLVRAPIAAIAPSGPSARIVGNGRNARRVRSVSTVRSVRSVRRKPEPTG